MFYVFKDGYGSLTVQRTSYPQRLAAVIPKTQVSLYVLVVSTAVFIAIFTTLSLRRVTLLGAGAYDLGIYQQAAWLMAQGEPLFVTVRGTHFFGDHFRPLLFLFVPFYRLWAHPFWLLLGQAGAIALGALPLYRLALRHTQRPWAAALVALGYLLHPAVFTMLFFDFHTILLSIPFMLWAIDAADEGRPGAFAVAAFGAALCKEEIALALASLSAYAALVRRHRWAWGGVIGSLVWFWLVLRVIAHFGGVEQSAYLSFYARWGETPGQIVTGILRQPVVALKALALCRGHFSQSGAYPLLLLAPFGFLPLFAGVFVLFGLPSYALLALSDWRTARELGFQHASLMVPWLAAASALAWGRLLRWSDGMPTPWQCQWQKLLVVTWLTCLALAVGRYATHTFRHFHIHVVPPERARAVKAALAKWIPPDASVSAPSALVPVLAHRRKVYLFPNPFQRTAWGHSAATLRQLEGRAWAQAPSRTVLHRRMRKVTVDYLVLQGRTNTWPLKPNDYEATVIGALTCQEYGIVAVVDDLVILRRGADFEAGLLRLDIRASPLGASSGGATDRASRQEARSLAEAVRTAWRQRKERAAWQPVGMGH